MPFSSGTPAPLPSAVAYASAPGTITGYAPVAQAYQGSALPVLFAMQGAAPGLHSGGVNSTGLPVPSASSIGANPENASLPGTGGAFVASVPPPLRAQNATQPIPDVLPIRGSVVKSSGRSGSPRAASLSSRPRPTTATVATSAAVPVPTGTKVLKIYRDSTKCLEAAIRGDLQWFEEVRSVDPLLQRGFESIRDFSGRTMLHLAAWHGHTEILATLLRGGGNANGGPLPTVLNWTSHNGNTLLHSAVLGAHPATVEWLVLNQFCQSLLSLRNAKGQLPVDCAMEVGRRDVIQIFNDAPR